MLRRGCHHHAYVWSPPPCRPDGSRRGRRAAPASYGAGAGVDTALRCRKADVLGRRLNVVKEASALSVEFVRAKLRRALPPDAGAARTVMTHIMGRVDGDGDRVVDAAELRRAMGMIATDITPGEVKLLVREIARLRSGDESGLSGGSLLADGGTVHVEDVCEFALAPPGAVPASAAARAKPQPVAHVASSGGHAPRPAPSPRPPANAVCVHGVAIRACGCLRSHVRFCVCVQKVMVSPAFEAFRARWEGLYGAAGGREIAADLMREPSGPTWTFAAPKPFKVVHLSAPPALPAARS